MANFDLDKKTFFRSGHEDDPVFCFFIRHFIIWHFIGVWRYRNNQFYRTAAATGWKSFADIGLCISCLPHLLSNYPSFLFIYGQLMYMKVHRLQLLLFYLLFQKAPLHLFSSPLYTKYFNRCRSLVQYAGDPVHCYHDHRQPVCIAAAEYQTFPCIFFHCTGWFYSGWYQQ